MKSPACQDCPGFEHSVFCSLKGTEMEVLESSKSHRNYGAGEAIFHSGDESHGLYCVQKGTVKLESNDNVGKSHLIQLIPSGGIIGYRALFTDEPYVSSALAVDPVEICFIPKRTILSLVEQSPGFALKFLSRLSHDFRMIETRFQHATSHSATERVAEALLFLRENFQEQNWTRKEIGEWAGTTTETTIRTLAQFEAEGLIVQKGRTITIVDRKGLLTRARITL